MSSTDNRIVRMVFDNAAFKRAAAETKSALTSVNDAITRAGKSRGLLNVTKDMQNVAVHASKMQVAMVTAIGTITNKAVNAGINLAKSLTLDPLKQGFHEYEQLLTKQNVIQNSTGKSAEVVKRYLNELNTYSDTTIYSFGNMTDAITKFTNAGVKLKPAVTSIRGIANAAAFAGADAEEAGRAMIGFSQAIGVGFMGLQDWKQIENANMGTTKFKEQLIAAAVATGDLTKNSKGFVTKSGNYVTATKGWRDGLKDQWLTTEALNTALAKYADSSKGIGKKAFAAATQVRTFTAFMGTLKESIGSGWAKVFTALLGGLDEATSMWTKLSLAVGGVVNGFFNLLSSSLEVWRAMGGAGEVAQGLKNILSPFVALFKAIGDAWKAAFPDTGKGAGSTLYGLSVAFKLLTTPLTWLAWIISQLVHPLTIFFQTIHLGGLLIGRVIGYVTDFVTGIFGLASFKMPTGDGAGTFLGWVKQVIHEVERAIGVLVSLLEEGASVKDAFKSLGDIDLKFPKLPELPDWMKGALPDQVSLPGIGSFSMPKIGSIFGGGGGGDEKSKIETVSTSVMDLASNVTDLDYVMQGLSENSLLGGSEKGDGFLGVVNIRALEGGMNKLGDATAGYGTNLRELESGSVLVADMMANASEKGNWFLDVLKNIGGAISDFFGNIRGEDIIHGLNFALLGTMGLTAAKMFKSFSDVMASFKGIGKATEKTIKQIGGAFGSFQTMARAELIKSIAIAIGILAVSLFLLSLIPRDKMITALMGLAGIIVALSAIMIIFTKVMDKLDQKNVTRKLFALGFALMAVGLALLFMAAAMVIFNYVDPSSVVKALVTLGVVFAGMIAIGKLAEKSGRKLIAAGVSMVLIGGALIILATGLLLFKLVDTGSMQKAGAAIAALVVSLLLLGMVPAARLAKAGTAILAISVAMLILANALIIFGAVKWESIGKAGAVLAGLTLALILMSGMGVAGAAVIVAVGAAMLAIAVACLFFNKVSWTAIAMAGVVLLGLIVAFAAFMAIVSFFTPAIIVLSLFAGSIAALALALGLLGVVFLALIPLSAVAATAFAAFAAAAAVAIAVFLQTLAAEMPTIKTAFLKIVKLIGEALAEAAPIVVQALINIIEAITKKAPEYVEAGVKLILALLDGIANSLDDIVKAAVDLVLDFLGAIIDGADDLIDGGIKLVEKLMEGIVKHTQTFIQAGVDLLVAFISGVATIMRDSGSAIGAAIADFIKAFFDLGTDLVEGLSEGMGYGFTKAALNPIGVIKSGLKGAKEAAEDTIKSRSPSLVFKKIGQFLVMGLTVGIQSQAAAAIAAVASVVSGQIAVANEYISKFVQKMDQQAIAARAKAEGLAAAADIASKSAEKTKKNEKDDAAAERLGKQAESAAEKADKLEERAQRAKDRANRDKEFAEASTLDKAKMKSEDAQTAIDDAKTAEARAAKDVAEARALGAQIKSGKYAKAEEDRMRKQADALRKDAQREAELANAYMATAKGNTAEALRLQKQAGAEAAMAYQKQFEDEARSDAEQDAFDAMSDTDKAVKRRADAALLQTQAAENLAKAKALAYTDIEAANELAGVSLDQAEQARQYVKDAIGYEQAVAEAARQAAEAAAGETPVTAETPVTPTVDLTASDQAALAFANMSDLYDSATAAAAAGSKLEFNQYNTSPESLTPTEIYRQTNNLLTHAQERLGQAA